MSKRILLADDSAAAKKSVENALGTDDYQLITAEDGRSAMEQINAVHPHLVLAHAMLPEVDGYELCRQVKENPATSHTPVLLLTGTFEPFDINRAKDARYDGFVTKPLDGPELLALVKRCIENAVYPAVDPVVEPEIEEAVQESVETENSVPQDRSDAMLDRIFPEEQDSEDDPVPVDDPIIITESSDEDIFSVVEPAEETTALPDADAEESDVHAGEAVDRRGPDFGIWGGAAETDVADEAAPPTAGPTKEEDGEKTEIESEDSDLSWFLRKYEEKMQVAEGDEAEEVATADETEEGMETLVTAPVVDLPPEEPTVEVGAVEELPEESEPAAMVVEVEPLEETVDEDVPVVEDSVPELDSLIPVADADAEPAASKDLDPDQLEQVARRVVELISDSVVRDVAWEAVPEIAERLIRERIREIEEEAEPSN